MGSELSRTFRRAAVLAATAGLLSAGVGIVVAPQAAALNSLRSVAVTSSAYVDSATPGVSHVDPTGAIPVGAHVQAHGPVHVTKAYFTFDLGQLAGLDLQSVSLVAPEASVTDCSVATTPQAWLTDTATHPTWRHQPAERTQLGAVQETLCQTPNLSWDSTQLVRDAQAAGRSTVTIVVRLPADEQYDPSHGIEIGSDASLLARFDRAPNVPTALTVQRTACSAQPVMVGRIGDVVGMTLSATVTDPDGDGVTGEFDWWPVNDPDQRQVLTAAGPIGSGSTAKVSILQSQLADATTYAWQVRATDGVGTSAFSPVCEFSTEFAGPPEAPIVTSTDYPSANPPGTGGVGETGTFTLSGSGDPDITGFAYGTSGSAGNFVPADQPGGAATIRFTPTSFGPNELTVFTVDRAGDEGVGVDYDFWVADNEPGVSCTPASAPVGVPRQCTFTPASSDVVGYQYQLGDGPVTDVSAAADGSSTVTITPSTANPTLFVSARLANGNLSARTLFGLPTDDGAPTVDQNPGEAQAGTPVQYTFHALLPDSVTFTYTFSDGTRATVPVGSDGTATVTLTSDSSEAIITVFSTTAGGVDSGTTTYFPFLDPDQPSVTSTDYPADAEGGGVGVPGTFTFTSPVPGVVSYTYLLDSDEDTVPADAAGTAQVVLSPTNDVGEEALLVTANFADGGQSDQAEYDFFVNPDPPAGVGSARITG